MERDLVRALLAASQVHRKVILGSGISDRSILATLARNTTQSWRERQLTINAFRLIDAGKYREIF